MQIKPLNHLLTTTSKALGFARVSDTIYDDVTVLINLDFLNGDLKPETQLIDNSAEESVINNIKSILEDMQISWKIYKKNLHSDDFNDDLLVKTTDALDLSNAKIDFTEGTVKIRSTMQKFSEPGIYYWVEEITSPLASEAVAKQEMRNLNETTVLETENTKYVKISTRKESPKLLATTGTSFGHLLFITIGSVLLAITVSKRRRRKKCTNIGNLEEIMNNGRLTKQKTQIAKQVVKQTARLGKRKIHKRLRGGHL